MWQPNKTRHNPEYIIFQALIYYYQSLREVNHFFSLYKASLIDIGETHVPCNEDNLWVSSVLLKSNQVVRN